MSFLRSYKSRSYLFFLGELKRGLRTKRTMLNIRFTDAKIVKAICFFFLTIGYVETHFIDWSLVNKFKKKRRVKLYDLRFRQNVMNPVLTDIKPFFKNGFFTTFKHIELALVKQVLTGIIVLSTSFGLVTHVECLFLGFGGMAFFTLVF